MTKKRQKNINKMNIKTKEKLLKIVLDITVLNLNNYDIKKILGENNKFRLRFGQIRIVFEKNKSKGEIKKIDFRGDIYK